MMYNNKVEALFFQPGHVGTLDLTTPLTVHFRSTQKNQVLTIIDLYLQCDTNHLVKKACFKATGNPFVIASLEWLCREIEGKDLETTASVNYEILVNELAIPHNQYPIALQVEDVYKEVLVLMNKKFEDYQS